MSGPAESRVVGRYALYGEIASGGMASVHVGRLLGPVGFSRTVAIKRLHPSYARDPEFVSMFLDEARLAARIRHPNVVPTLDVVATQGELFLVMEYVQGESLSQLVKAAARQHQRIPLRVALSILSGALQGLHAAHEARDEQGMTLGLVHRDVSPQNVLVGVDGMARVFDFGVAKAAGRAHNTREGVLKGKLAYMAPEQIHQQPVDRAADIYAAAVVLWEVVTGTRLFRGDSEGELLAQVLAGEIHPPSSRVPDLPPELDAIVMRGLAKSPSDRYATAREMALTLDRYGSASLGEVAEWLESIAGPTLAKRAAVVSAVEAQSSRSDPAYQLPPDYRAIASSIPGIDETPADGLEPGTQSEPRSPASALPSSRSSAASITLDGTATGEARGRRLQMPVMLGLVAVAAFGGAAIALSVVQKTPTAASLPPAPPTTSSPAATAPPPTPSSAPRTAASNEAPPSSASAASAPSVPSQTPTATPAATVAHPQAHPSGAPRPKPRGGPPSPFDLGGRD